MPLIGLIRDFIETVLRAGPQNRRRPRPFRPRPLMHPAIVLSLAAAPALALALPDGLASPLNDYNPSLDQDERTMVFARSEAEFRGAKIYVAQRSAEGWSAPQPIDFSDPRYADSDPWLTPDGQTLYFISDRPAPSRAEGRRDYDIWRARREANGWSAPERLGDAVNSAGQELGPELHGGVLTFSSARRSGAGGLDIYQAAVAGDGFAPASLLPGPFNTAASESDFTLSPDGRAAMFWRSEGTRGVIHIAYREGDGWSVPQPLPDSINIGPFNFTPAFSRDGTRVRFATTRERPGQASGLADIHEAALPAR